MKVLVVVRGLPGSGKTTFAQDIMAQGDKMVAADDFMVDDNGDYFFDTKRLGYAHMCCRNAVELFMRAGEERIFVHNTFTTAMEMRPILKLARKYEYKIHSIIVENRHNGVSVHDVPEDRLETMRRRFDIALTSGRRDVVDILRAMRSTAQREDYHPELDVYTHTAYVVTSSLVCTCEELVWAAFFHDFGKIDTTCWDVEKDLWTSYGHECASVEYLYRFHKLIPANVDFDVVKWLVSNHMRIEYLAEMGEKKSRELIEHPSFNLLCKLHNNDNMLAMFYGTSSEERKNMIEAFEGWLDDIGIDIP